MPDITTTRSAALAEYLDCRGIPFELVARLVLAGPPRRHAPRRSRGCRRLAEVRARWAALDDATRRRIDVVSLPATTLSTNAAIVNALQRQGCRRRQEESPGGLRPRRH
jgi:hypothetical protein